MNEQTVISEEKSDLIKFLELYQSFDIDIYSAVTFEHDGTTSITLRVTNEEEKFSGYVNCYSLLLFDRFGKFVQQGFWEDLDEDFGDKNT